MIKVFTDGACSGNPGIGGWGVVILINDSDPIFLKGGEIQTTNNRMELTATIKALKYFISSLSTLINLTNVPLEFNCFSFETILESSANFPFS